MLVGYARVSTQYQNLELQKDALNTAKCERIFEDKSSGAKAERPGLIEAISFMRSGDTLVIWKLSRLGRSLKQLIETVQLLQDKGIELKSLNESIDTASAAGKLLFHIVASFAQFDAKSSTELDDLGFTQLTKAGLDAARSRGKHGGRPKKLDEKKAQLARQWSQDKNRSVKEICELLKISRATYYNYTGERIEASKD